MKNNHWRSFKKGMSWFLMFAIAIGSQGTGLSAATLDYGQDYGYQQEKSYLQTVDAEDTTQVEDISAQAAMQTPSIPGRFLHQTARETPPRWKILRYRTARKIRPRWKIFLHRQRGRYFSGGRYVLHRTAKANTSQIEDVFTDGDSVLADNHEETADTTFLDAPADVKEGTIQYQIEEARKAGSTTLTISLDDSFPATVEENLLIPRGMEIVLDLNGHTLTVDKSFGRGWQGYQ